MHRLRHSQLKSKYQPLKPVFHDLSIIPVNFPLQSSDLAKFEENVEIEVEVHGSIEKKELFNFSKSCSTWQLYYEYYKSLRKPFSIQGKQIHRNLSATFVLLVRKQLNGGVEGEYFN